MSEGDRLAAAEEKLEQLALGMLPPFDGRRRPAAATSPVPRNKRAEWEEYRQQVTSWELDRYLPKL